MRKSVLIVLLGACVLAGALVPMRLLRGDPPGPAVWIGYVVMPDGSVSGAAFPDRDTCEAVRQKVEKNVAETGAPITVAPSCVKTPIHVPRASA